MLSGMSTEGELRERLWALAEAARLPIPMLHVAPDPKERLLPARVKHDAKTGEDGIVVSSTLLTADADEQTWHLASCLGWWSSPVPKRRRREYWGVCVVLLLAYLALGGLVSFGLLAVPSVVVMLPGALGLYAGIAAMSRRERRALEDAGSGVLEANGYDPAALTRQVFARQVEPSGLKRWHSVEPTPRQRIAAAEARLPA